LKSIGFHRTALAEFKEAARYYDRQQRGLGLRFVAAVEGALVRIKDDPLKFRLVDSDVRKCRVTRFPYGVIFREREGHIQVIAVMHLHRDPNYWKGRV
jgi:plasmid stabilization system protein ParE